MHWCCKENLQVFERLSNRQINALIDNVTGTKNSQNGFEFNFPGVKMIHYLCISLLTTNQRLGFANACPFKPSPKHNKYLFKILSVSYQTDWYDISLAGDSRGAKNDQNFFKQCRSHGEAEVSQNISNTQHYNCSKRSQLAYKFKPTLSISKQWLD